MEEHEILARLVRATMPLLANEKLGRFNVREQAIMHRLAGEMKPLFPDWDVDADYNRRGDEVKRLAELGGGRRDIRPDILVHIMGEPQNLLAVELKLGDNNDIDDDIFKLEGLTHPDKGFAYPVCQSARNVDPLSARNVDPFVCDQRLACPALAGVAKGGPSAGDGDLRL